MALTPGTKVGVYEVTGTLGAGGMGEVYRARDTKLDRDVALKVLPEAVTADPDRLARFEREAKVLASLNHPNIGGIHGFEDSGDARALVLELVEGETLEERIARGPIPVEDALPIASQIAAALEAAHESGVVHRDLKPANIKVREDGTVKVLDFGLAKALDAAPEGDPSLSPTLTAAATQVGVILGTAAYMAPEQAKGKSVDRRADIWAFGAVLFEMLSGRRAFAGEDIADTLAYVLTRPVDWTVLPSDLPPSLSWLLKRCLDRDPTRRLRDIGEARVLLDGADVAPEPVATELPRSQGGDRSGPTWMTVVSGTLGAGVVVWSLADGGVAPVGPPLRFSAVRVTAPLADIAVSPDGTRLAYISGLGDDGRLVIRDLARDTSTPIDTSVGGGAVSLSFSPDNEWVAVYSPAEEALVRVRVDGATVIPFAETAEQPYGVSWGPDDTVVFSAAGRLMRVSANGGTPQPVTTDEGGLAQRWPEVLPGGRDVLFSLSSGQDTPRLAIASIASGTVRELGIDGSRPRYAPSGRLVFADRDRLRSAPFDPDTGALANTSVVSHREEPTVGFLGELLFDLADAGTLTYAGGAEGVLSLVWVDREGREEAIAAPAGLYITPRLSSDGLRVAFDRNDAGDSNIWVRDLSRGTETRITSVPEIDWLPLWTPDDRRLVFYSRREPSGLYSKAADGTGDAELMVAEGNDVALVSPSDWSADGRTLAVWMVTSAGQPDLGLVSLDGTPTIEPMLPSRDEEGAPAFSPDGGWLAYHSAESGQREVYVRRFPSLSDRTTVSVDGGSHPQWSRDGRELFYRTLDGGMRVVQVETVPTFRVLGESRLLFEGPYFLFASRRTYDVAPDGQRFLMLRSSGASDAPQFGQSLEVVVNWTAQLPEGLVAR